MVGSLQTRGEWEANASEVKLAEKAFQVGLIHDQFGLGGSQVFDFVEALEQAHLGDGVLFRAGHFPADSLAPLLNSAVADEDAYGKNFLAIHRDHVNVLSPRQKPAAQLLDLVEMVLIDVAGCGGGAFDAANPIGACHGPIIRWGRGDGNSGGRGAARGVEAATGG